MSSNTTAGECYAPGAVGLPLQSSFMCLPHFFCPNSTQASQIPYYCPPTQQCMLDRLLGKACQPQGRFEPVVCYPGNYCPDQWNVHLCPKGYYCPTGSVAPIKCEPMSSCPPGSQSPTYYGGLVICLIVDMILGAIILYKKRNELLMSKGARFHQVGGKHDADTALQVTPEPTNETEMSEVKHQSASQPPSAARGPDIEQGDIKSPPTRSPPTSTPTSPTTPTKPTTPPSALLRGFNRSTNNTPLTMSFKFQNLGLRLKNGRSIIAGVNGEIRCGTLTAIMGPSGAGKTTFMSVLMGKVARTEGKLFINGREGEMSKFKKIIGYVPQEDVMLREMTVRENILHAARVKLPADWTSTEIETYADAIIEALGLSHVAHTPIGDETTRGVSGGQRKRVNIGIELAGVPLTLFLDEPTSGLDSTSALSVCENLKDISHLGVTVVSVIHQPRYEIFRSFDWLVLLVPGGQTAYMGPTEGAQGYFEDMGFQFDPTSNPADLLMDILAGHGINPKQTLTPTDLVAAWERRQSTTLPPPSPGQEDPTTYRDFHTKVPALIRQRGATWWKQVWYCHNRALIQHYRNLSSFVLEIFVGCFAGAMIGIATGGNQMFSGVYVQPYTFLSPSPVSWFIPLLGLLIGMIVSLAGAPAGVKVFSEERPIYFREVASGHNPLSYYLGKTLGALYRFTFSSLHFTAMYVLLAKPQAPFSRQFVVVFLLFYGVYGLSAIVSMVTKRGNANLVAVISCLFAAIFCGFGPNLKQARRWGVDFIWAISYNRWASEAIFSDYLRLYWGIYDIESVADSTGYTLGRFGHDMGMMVLLGAAWRVIAFLLMVFTNRDKQK
ncbi:hypothetical protein HDV00_012522 [Rhizophlyctis rosea]|nr:hypothetical protein HDV00_012522 [Rhizophlyctis rosea]